MRITIPYAILWLTAVLAGIALYLTDSFDYATTMMFGFSVSVLAGAAPLVIFPLMMSLRMAEARAMRRRGP